MLYDSLSSQTRHNFKEQVLIPGLNRICQKTQDHLVSLGQAVFFTRRRRMIQVFQSIAFSATSLDLFLVRLVSLLSMLLPVRTISKKRWSRKGVLKDLSDGLSHKLLT